jgi:hypothetical protein
MKSLTRVEIAVACISFAGIFVVGIAGKLLPAMQSAVPVLILLLFFLFGFACIGLMIHAFIALQAGIGNAGLPMVRFLREHERGVTYGAWGFLGVGVLIAAPFALHDMGLEFKLPVAKAKGLLVADIGMTLDDVQRRSTIRLAKTFTDPSGQTYCIGRIVFDYQMNDSAIRFPQSRYYWMTTAKHHPHLNALNIGITPEKLPRSELNAFRRRMRQALKDDGWMPGHFVYTKEEDIHLVGGRTIGDGRYWLKHDTLLIFEENRMDDQKPGEDRATAGQWILYIDLRPRDHEPRLVFEASAWTGE